MDTYIIHGGTNWSNSVTIRTNTSAQTSLTQRSVRVWQPLSDNWAWRTVHEVNTITNNQGGFMVPVWDLPLLFPSIEAVHRLHDWNAWTGQWVLGNRYNITRTRFITPEHPGPEPIDQVPTPTTVLARPWLTVTLNTTTTHSWRANEFVDRNLAANWDTPPWVDVRDVARSFGDYDIEFVRGGRWHRVRSTGQDVWFAHDTYIVHANTAWSNHNTIRTDTSNQTTLTNRNVMVFHPATNTWNWRTVNEVNTITNNRGGFMFQITDMNLFFPSVSQVSQGGILHPPNVAVPSIWNWNEFNIVRHQFVPPEPIFSGRQERPNDTHVTGTQLIVAIHNRFVGPVSSNNTAIQWAINEGLIDGLVQAPRFPDRVATQPEVYGIIANFFGSSAAWSGSGSWTHRPINAADEWARPGVNRAQANGWFFSDYNQSRGLSLHDLNRLLDAAWAAER
ncbi:hypothetical protein FWC63_02895 [Candidatus Saccharibacteria bacterium]|nr:hypothetical protein [Candidatus Saccharibacteria bacterium]